MRSIQSMAEAPPTLQPVQAPEEQPRPLLLEGYIQTCEGYLERKTKILKRWKTEYFRVAPGKMKERVTVSVNCVSFRKLV